MVRKSLLILFASIVLLGSCTFPSITPEPTAETPAPAPVPPAPVITPVPTVEEAIPTINQTAESEEVDWPVARSIDIANFQSGNGGKWFSVVLEELPETQLEPEAFFHIEDHVQDNHANGSISPTLLAGYFFLQLGISSSSLEQYIDTIGALFIRSAWMSFVDYPDNRVLGWDRTSVNIPADIRGIIRLCNEKKTPVFLEINYSDYVPGELGSGIESLDKTDNIANTIFFLEALRKESLHLDGITFGDQIEDESGFGLYKPTTNNSDIIGKFISYARAIKSEFPELKIYAFESYIPATRGGVSTWWDYFKRVRQAEIEEGMVLLDGFTFTESYIYIDENGELLESQLILDDTESLYRDTPVYRYDVWGNSHPNPDTAYLPDLISKTSEIFGRRLDIGLTEYLPAVPLQVGETDTSRYSDIDFILHSCDIYGIYAQLGLNFVSRMMFANDVEQHKSYFDREGNLGVNYPVQEQLARHFYGEILEVDNSVDYDELKIKVYVARQGTEYLIMILNKDVEQGHAIRITVPERLDLKAYIPKCSYTSLIINDSGVKISGIGN